MACVHLQQLFRLCHEQEIKLASSDLIHIVCTQCDEHEVCPSMLTDEYDAREQASNPQPTEPHQSAR